MSMNDCTVNKLSNNVTDGRKETNKSKNGSNSKKRKLNDSTGKKIGRKRKNIEIHEAIIPYHLWSLKIEVAKDSLEIGKETFQWLISPQPIDEFFGDYWEKKPLLLRRTSKDIYKGLLSTKIIDKILRNHNIQFTKNIDITSYRKGTRETHNLEGRALATSVWNFYNDGCSVRMLNPQTFHKPVWLLLSTLQEYFKSFCGANVYLTPPDSQGFAPHYDDIEAFILQLEGKKRWRVYAPRSDVETLPRESSKNFGPRDKLGEPLMDIVLNQGDLLYFPRGFIHQGEAIDGEHSLHITLSTYQKTSYVDLLEKLLPKALAEAAKNDIEFRRGLPLHFSDEGGIVNSGNVSTVRNELVQKVSSLVEKMMVMAPIDESIDDMAKEFIYSSLPPVLNEDETECSVYGGGERWDTKSKSVVNRAEISSKSSIRLIRKNCCRLVKEGENENRYNLYYNLENSREYRAEDLQFLEVDSDMAPGIEELCNEYPQYVDVQDLPLESLEQKIQLAMGLWDKGIITTENPLSNESDEEDLK